MSNDITVCAPLITKHKKSLNIASNEKLKLRNRWAGKKNSEGAFEFPDFVFSPKNTEHSSIAERDQYGPRQSYQGNMDWPSQYHVICLANDVSCFAITHQKKGKKKEERIKRNMNPKDTG